MPTADGMRAGDADRDRTVRALQGHYQAGRLTVEELEERTQRAVAARTLGDLQALMSDLPEEAVPPPEGSPSGAPACRRTGRVPLAREAARYGTVMVTLVVIWALSGRGYFWPVWPMLAWGLAMVSRALGVPPRQSRGQPSVGARRWRDRGPRLG